MNQWLRSDGPADPNGPTMGLVLLRGFESAAFIKVRKFVVTSTAAIAILLFWTMQHVACEEIARCNCIASVFFALPDRALPA